MKKADMITGVILSLFSIAIYWVSMLLPQSISTTPGPGFFPKVVAGALFICSIALFCRSLLNKESKQVAIENNSIKRLLFSFMLLIAFPLLISYLGFITGCFIVVLLYLKLLDVKPVTAGAASAVISGMVYALFHYCLQVSLPEGFF